MGHTFTFYYDPGHAWLEVSTEEMRRVGVKPSQISSCSWKRKGRFYLEEDCDAGVFLRAYEAKHGHAPEIVETELKHRSEIGG